MNKQVLLKKILQNPDLAEKYWPDIDPEEHNTQTIQRSNNKYLKVLGELMAENTDNFTFKAITQIFKL